MRTQCWDAVGVEKKMEPSFEKLLGKLTEAEIRFIVVGGLAVTLNRYVRLTELVDFVIDASDENVLQRIEFLRGFGEGFGGSLSAEDFKLEPGAIRVIEASEDCQMDIFTLIGGFTYDDLIHESETSSVNGQSFHYVSKEQLISIKSSSTREKDRIDISAMKQLIENPEAFD